VGTIDTWCWHHAVLVNRIARRNPVHPTSLRPAHAAPYHQHHDATLYASLELSHATWLVTSLSPGSEKMSKHSLAGGEGKALVGRWHACGRRQKMSRADRSELPSSGGWPRRLLGHRLLETNGIESHVVDPASIAVPRRHRRAKTNAIDGGATVPGAGGPSAHLPSAANAWCCRGRGYGTSIASRVCSPVRASPAMSPYTEIGGSSPTS
jgi:hypothetical protein